MDLACFADRDGMLPETIRAPQLDHLFGAGAGEAFVELCIVDLAATTPKGRIGLPRFGRHQGWRFQRGAKVADSLQEGCGLARARASESESDSESESEPDPSLPVPGALRGATGKARSRACGNCRDGYVEALSFEKAMGSRGRCCDCPRGRERARAIADATRAAERRDRAQIPRQAKITGQGGPPAALGSILKETMAPRPRRGQGDA